MSCSHPAIPTSFHPHEVKQHATEHSPIVPDCKICLQIKGGVPWWLVPLSSETVLPEMLKLSRYGVSWGGTKSRFASEMTSLVDAVPILKDQRHQLSLCLDTGHPLGQQVVQLGTLQWGYPKD